VLVRYKVIIKKEARKEFEGLPVIEQERVDIAILRLQNDLTGDVKKLKNFIPRYRLRIGRYRVLFEIEGDTIVIHSVKPRKDAYR
jgi:mRNA interferase RelE/StbE